MKLPFEKDFDMIDTSSETVTALAAHCIRGGIANADRTLVADTLRALTAERDAALADSKHWQANYKGLLAASEAAAQRLTAERDTAVAEARKAGWKACIDHLMQGGSQTGCDFVSADGKALGRFHGFFPAGATPDDKAAFYEELAKWERAMKDAKPISWADLD